jgi:hypothetical protein
MLERPRPATAPTAPEEADEGSPGARSSDKIAEMIVASDVKISNAPLPPARPFDLGAAGNPVKTARRQAMN